MIVLEKDMIRELIVKEKRRMCERGFYDYRKIKIEKNIIKTAEGSARVDIGQTKVIAGIKMEIGEPFPDTPDEGIIVVNAEFVPFASPEFLPGPPDEYAIELARIVDRVIRESKAIDLKKLVIKDVGQVWKIMIDILVLDNDGNLKDASTLASVAALLDTKLPSYKVNNDKIEIDHENISDINLPIMRLPVSVTMSKISNIIMVDPDAIEEKASDAILTIGYFEENGEVFLCAIQKGGSKGLMKEEIEKAIDIAIDKGKEIRKLL